MKTIFTYSATLLAFCFFAGVAEAKQLERTPVNLEQQYNTTGINKPSKAPSKSISLSVEYDEENHTLYFCDDNSNTIEYNILNSGCDCILQGTCNFDANGHYSVLVPTTQNGTYTIYITVNNTLYKGEFTITE